MRTPGSTSTDRHALTARAASRSHNRNRSAAFTLIELVVAIIVLGILLAVALPSFFGSSKAAQDSSSQQYLTVSFHAARVAATPNEDTFPSADQLSAAIASSEPELNVAVGTCTDAQGATNPRSLYIDPNSTGSDMIAYSHSASGTVWQLDGPATGQHTIAPATCADGTATDAVTIKGTLAYTAADYPGGIYGVGSTNGVQSLISDPAPARDPAFSPNGSKIAFIDTAGQLWVANADGSTPQLLFPQESYQVGDQSTTTWVHGPAWAPDGSKLAYLDGCRDQARASCVWVVSADGGAPTQLTHQTGWTVAAATLTPSFTPNGSTIVYAAWRFNASTSALVGVPHVFSVPVAGGEAQQLTSGSNGESYPAVSPDGATIAYGDSGDSGNPAIYTIPVHGGTPRLLVSGAGAPIRYAPNGSRIAFTGIDSNVYTIPASGGVVTRLTDGVAVSDYVWSPDSTMIAYADVIGDLFVTSASADSPTAAWVAVGATNPTTVANNSVDPYAYLSWAS